MSNENNPMNPDFKPVEWNKPPTVAEVPAGGGLSFSFISRRPSLRFWVFKPSGDPECDYRAGRHYGEEVLEAATDNPRLVGDLLSKAMLFLPEDGHTYRHILRGLFERLTEELARSAVTKDAADYEHIEVKTPGA